VNMLFIVIGVIIGVACVLLNVAILLQKKRSAGLSGTMAGMGSGQTYWDKNKGRSLEGQLEFWSKILGAVFMLLCLVLSFIK